MASKKKNYKQRAGVLRELGLLPKGYRTNALNESQKRHIRRTEQKLKKTPETLALLNKPGKYLAAPISAKHGKQLHEKGYPVLQTKQGRLFYAERQHADSVKFRAKDGTIIRKFANRTNTTYPLDDAPATLRRIERFFKTKKDNQYLTFRIGDKSPFNISIHSMRDFEKYVVKFDTEMTTRQGKLIPGSRKKYPTTNPANQLQIVEVTEYGDAEDYEN